MIRLKLELSVILLIFLGVAEPLCAQSPKGSSNSSSRPPAVVFVETPVKSWTDGYANWVTSHPAVVLALDKGSGVQIKLQTPFLDYFASDGNSVYSDTSAPANIDFLHKLPQSGQKKGAGEGKSELVPTLGDYLDMFPKLKPYRVGILAQKRPVLLAICKDDAPACVLQNQALSDFKHRAASLGIQVVEVKLLKNPQGQ